MITRTGKQPHEMTVEELEKELTLVREYLAEEEEILRYTLLKTTVHIDAHIVEAHKRDYEEKCREYRKRIDLLTVELRQRNRQTVEVLEYADQSGHIILYEKFEGFLPVEDFDQNAVYKQHCEGCGKYNKNLSCPPHSPTFARHIKGAKTARVVCVRIGLEYFACLAAEDKYRAGHQLTRDLLVGILLAYRKQGFIIAGSGACSACQKCVVELDGHECLQPDRQIVSLESLGVNVIALVSECFDFDLEWSADEQTATFVSAVGAVFYE